MPTEPVGPQVERVMRRLNENAALAVRGAVGEVWAKLVDGTPVDTLEYTDIPGVARGNWNFSIGTEDTTFSESRANPSGPAPAIPDVPLVAERIYMVNATPYAAVLEYGGYPVPVKRGSYNRATHRYVIKSAGGFSQQAPSGWVRVVAAMAPAIFRQWVGRVRSG